MRSIAPSQAAGPSLATRLGAVPPRAVVAGAAALLAVGIGVTIGRERPAEPARPIASPPAAAARPAPAILEMLALLGRALPPGAALAEAQRDAGGSLFLEIETAEPDRLREGLARAPGLAGLRSVGETALPDGGFRVRLEQRAQAAASRAPDRAANAGLLQRVRESARDLLVERLDFGGRGVALTVSGPEPAVVRILADFRMAEWRMAAIGDGAVRLSGIAVPGAPDRTAGPGRALFDVAGPPAPADAPALAGIVGRMPDDAVALLRGEDGRARTVAVGGDAGGGWRLTALAPDAALFARGAERVRVPLPGDGTE